MGKGGCVWDGGGGVRAWLTAYWDGGRAGDGHR
jgi:hypothetical protein